jgi:hypothetical protein
VSNRSKVMTVRRVDDGFADIGRHLRHAAEFVVQPQFDEINTFGRLSVYRRGCFGSRGNGLIDTRKAAVPAFEDQPLARRIETRHGRVVSPMRGAELENQIRVGSQAHHGGHAVTRIDLKIVLDTLLREVPLVLHHVDRVGEVHVQIDDAGHHVFPGAVHDLRVGGSVEGRRATYPLNAPIIDDHRRIARRRMIRPIDEREALQDDSCRPGARACEAQQHRRCENEKLRTLWCAHLQ